MVELLLDRNDLTALPEGIFAGLSNLRWLGLYSSGLTALPENVFEGLSSLELLNLSHNNLIWPPCPRTSSPVSPT